MTALTRRSLLHAAFVTLAAPRAIASKAPSRIAIVDWAMLETALAIGVTPVGATELVQYRRDVIEPPLSPGTTDVGLRGALNYELISALQPDHIISSNFYAEQRALLARIAPVETFSIYAAGASPFVRATEAALSLGEIVGRRGAAERYVAGVASDLAMWKAELKARDVNRVLVINLGDPRHFRAFGADSMFGDTLAQLGVANAWTQTTRYSAAAPVGLDKLSEIDDTIALVGPMPLATQLSLASNAIWNALPAVRQRKVVHLGSINHFGGLPAAHRFAKLLTKAVGEVRA